MNRSILRTSAALVALAWSAMVASAQTTKPSDRAERDQAEANRPPTWAATAERVARAAEKGDGDAVAAAMTHDAAVRTIEEDERVPARQLAISASEWTLLGTHAYAFPPATLARDIAHDVNRSDLVPDKEKAKITPIDDADLARANATAAEWVARTLAAERDQLVAVAVYWNIKLNRPMFVLLKGQQASGDFAVTQAVYGDPMQRRATASTR